MSATSASYQPSINAIGGYEISSLDIDVNNDHLLAKQKNNFLVREQYRDWFFAPVRDYESGRDSGISLHDMKQQWSQIIGHEL